MYYKEGEKKFKESKYVEAIEKFSMALATKEKEPLALRDIARCYFRLENFEMAKQRFEELAKYECWNGYATSMLATIMGYQGDYEEAIKVLKSTSKTVNNIINLASFYFLQFTYDKKEYAIHEARKILDTLNVLDIEDSMKWRVYLAYGMIYQALNEYGLAESSYKKALHASRDNHSKAMILDEYGGFCTMCDRVDKAETLLNEAVGLIAGTHTIEEGLVYKNMGCLHLKKGDPIEAKEYFLKAAHILKDKKLYKELAAVHMYLSDLLKTKLNIGTSLEEQRTCRDMMDLYAEGVHYEILTEEVSEVEKIIHCMSDSSSL